MSNRGQTIIRDVPPKGKRPTLGRKHKEHESMNADAQSGKLQARVKTNLDEYKVKIDKVVDLIREVEKAIEELNTFEVTVEFMGIESTDEENKVKNNNKEGLPSGGSSVIIPRDPDLEQLKERVDKLEHKEKTEIRGMRFHC